MNVMTYVSFICQIVYQFSRIFVLNTSVGLFWILEYGVA